MTILVNCSNLKNGGGLQVSDSFIRKLDCFPHHFFVVVQSNVLTKIIGNIKDMPNVKFFSYDIKNNFPTLCFGRDRYLDNLLKKYHVNAVLTLFGPSRWRPRVPHLCGFARAQLLLTDSPYYKQLSLKNRIIYRIWKWGFRKSSKVFYTENAYISNLLPNLVGRDKRIYTVTNYYHQVFDQPEKWKNNHQLDSIKGCTLLTVSSNATHKNLPIMAKICEVMKQKHPDFHFRFVLSLNKKQCPWYNDKYKKYFVFLGKVDVSECPLLYEQADIMFMPSLMECFTATYPEAMRMEVPIVTTDLEFAHGLCGNAACYYSAIDPEAAADAIYKVAIDKEYARQLTEAGKKQLLKFDNYEQRAEKLIAILENIAKQ